MTREQMIELLNKHNYRLVEYMDEILNIYDLEEAEYFEETLIDMSLTHVIYATLPNQFIFDEYVKFYKDKYNEDFLISKETGKICW